LALLLIKIYQLLQVVIENHAFFTDLGVVQSDVLSAILFNVYLEKAL